jgi:hypothetical protein
VNRMRSMRRGVVAVVLAVPLAGCIVVPQTRDIYDPDCRVARREIALATAVVGGFAGCSDRDCAALLATLGVVTAASVVISGSIALVGNVVYWLEHQGRCRRDGVEPSAAPALPASPGPAPAASAPA